MGGRREREGAPRRRVCAPRAKYTREGTCSYCATYRSDHARHGLLCSLLVCVRASILNFLKIESLVVAESSLMSTTCDDAARAWCAKRQRTRAAANAVLYNSDIVACILRGNVGPSTFAAASEVSRAWLAVCRQDNTVLRAVALYQGSMTKAKLMHLFAIAGHIIEDLPHTTHARRGGGTYSLYCGPAVDKLLSNDGAAAWRLRLQARAQSPWSLSVLWPPPPCPPRRAHWQEEARLHAQSRQKGEREGGRERGRDVVYFQ